MDSIKYFSFKSDNFHNALSLTFYSYLENGKFCDCSLSTERKFISAHKIMLSASSGYFEQMFELGDRQQSHVIIINEVAYEDLLSVLEFAYKGETKIKAENYERFLKAANLLQLKGLQGLKGNNENIMEYAPAMTPPPESVLPEISLEAGILDAMGGSFSESIVMKHEPMSPQAKEKLSAKRKSKNSAGTSDENSPMIRNKKVEKTPIIKTRRHSIAVNPVPCKFCHKVYSKNSVHGHEKSCKENPSRIIHQCPICKKELSRNDKLILHMKVHDK